VAAKREDRKFKYNPDNRMNNLHLLQRPAMFLPLFATPLTASQHRQKRLFGFRCFLISNASCLVRGWHAGACATVVMQINLTLLRVRNAWKNEPAARGIPETPQLNSNQ